MKTAFLILLLAGAGIFASATGFVPEKDADECQEFLHMSAVQKILKEAETPPGIPYGELMGAYQTGFCTITVDGDDMYDVVYGASGTCVLIDVCL